MREPGEDSIKLVEQENARRVKLTIGTRSVQKAVDSIAAY
jgi:hypothetical protein